LREVGSFVVVRPSLCYLMAMAYGRKDTAPSLLYILEHGISYDEILEPILLASCFQLEMGQGSPSWSIETYLTRSVVSHLDTQLVEILWQDVGVHFNVTTYHPKMLQVVGAVLRCIGAASSHH
jgi:hypothetical protein